MKFRKKPIEIEAIQWDGSEAGAREVIKWCASENVFSCEGPGDLHEMEIETLEGRMTVSEGDWVIRGIKGELYPCKPDIFAATYDPVG